MTQSPIKYTSRTFLTILNDINAVPELVDKPNWFKYINAGVGDMLSMINNAQANDSYLGTAYTRQAVKELCALIGYTIPEQTTSTGTQLFYFPSTVTFPFTVDASNLAATTKGSVAVSSKRFESRGAMTFAQVTDVINITANPPAAHLLVTTRDYYTGEKVRLSTSGVFPTGLSGSMDYYIIRSDATHIAFATSVSNAFAGNALAISDGSGNLTLTLYSGRATCYQQEAKEGILIGSSDGVTGWQEFDLPDFLILDDTLVITVNGTQWTKQDTLALSKSYDPHYVLVYRTDGSAFIRFGNGTYGAIPGNFDILADYSIGGGVDANVSALNSISVYAGSDANISGTVNVTTFTGGSDQQSIETAKNTAPGTLKSRDRFVTVDDGESLAKSFGGIALANVVSNAYGVLSAKVVCIAIGGGNPNATTKTNLQAFLIARTLFAGVDIRVVEATITPVNVTAAAKILTGYTWGGVEPFFRLAWKLLFAETGQEIVDLYKSDGIASAVARINTLFGESFTSADYGKIQNQLDALYKFGAAAFGSTIRDDDIKAFIRAYVDGIDYFTYSAPTVPLTFGTSEISTYGTLTLSEIV